MVGFQVDLAGFAIVYSEIAAQLDVGLAHGGIFSEKIAQLFLHIQLQRLGFGAGAEPDR